jgi:hypothetical protein
MVLAELYEDLAQSPAVSGTVERRLAPQCPLDIFAFAEKPSNRLGFRIVLPPTALAEGQDLPNLRGLHLARQNRADGLNLILTAALPAFHEVFISLASDLVGQAEHETKRDVAAAALLGRLARWQAFLKHLPLEGLGPEAQRGLYGELWLMRHRILTRWTASEAVRAWTGPFRTEKDFQFAGGSVEVKTSIAGGDQKLEIHGERQMDDTGLLCLLLAHLSLEPVQEAGETLPAMVHAVRAIVSDDFAAQQALDDRLREAGYLDAHEAKYKTPGYLVREFNLFHVREGFPRLTEAMLPPGVGNVKYKITVSACELFRAQESQLWALWEESA